MSQWYVNQHEKSEGETIYILERIVNVFGNVMLSVGVSHKIIKDVVDACIADLPDHMTKSIDFSKLRTSFVYVIEKEEGDELVRRMDECEGSGNS